MLNMRERNFIEEERCDNEKEVFNARVNENEMIITIEEYENLKKQITYMKEKDKEQFELRNRVRDENMALNKENTKLKKENIALKKGILTFVILFGGMTND